MADSSESFYVIGIDFGTTYSGVAWCWSGQPDNIETVTKWKTRLNLNHDNAKVPTEIQYGSNTVSWGYDVSPEEEPIRWFKLLLVQDTDLTPDLRTSTQIRRARQLVREHYKTAVAVIADYLRLLWNHAIEDITRSRGESAVKGSTFQVWITVPAIWQEDACGRMREAAERAGITERRTAGPTTLELVAEPEAAALAVLDDFKGRPDVQVGDVFVVCDAGGGTVDIISYVIQSTEPMIVRECVEGKGKMCGAIFVDEGFEKMLSTSLGDKWKRLSATSKKMIVNNDWEHGIKRLFDDSDREWNVTVPAEAFRNRPFKLHPYDQKGGDSSPAMKDGQLKFKKGHIRAFFAKVLPGIRSLIHEQVKSINEKQGKQPKAILLVGGLGSCQYLYQELKKEFGAHAKNIAVLQPSGARPWTAIFRGAVIRGLSDAAIESKKSSLVVSRVSRVNYGMSFQTRFREHEHDLADRYWDDQQMEWKAKNQMRWYMRRGDDVLHDTPIKVNYYRLYDDDTRSQLDKGKFTIQLYRNTDEIAPSKITDGVQPLIKVTVRVDCPFDDLPEWENKDGDKFRRLSYDVEMTPTGMTMHWKCYIDGKVQGEQNVKIEQRGNFQHDQEES